MYALRYKTYCVHVYRKVCPVNGICVFKRHFYLQGSFVQLGFFHNRSVMAAVVEKISVHDRKVRVVSRQMHQNPLFFTVKHYDGFRAERSAHFNRRFFCQFSYRVAQKLPKFRGTVAAHVCVFNHTGNRNCRSFPV